jgi:hypothetical protein
MQRIALALTAGLLAALSLTQPAQAVDGNMVFANRLEYGIIVAIYHSDGTLQKRDAVGPGNYTVFSFGASDRGSIKNRQFIVTRKSDGEQIASGKFQLWNKCHELGGCDVNVREAPELTFGEPDSKDVDIRFDLIKENRGRFVVKPALPRVPTNPL